MMLKTLWIASITVCAALAVLPCAHAEQPAAASAFLDSVGVNIHLHYNDTAYNDFAQVERAIQELGIRHVRDGLIDSEWQPYYDRLTQLHHDGIGVLGITSRGQAADQIGRALSKAHGAFEAVEAPNEIDASGDPQWVAQDSAALATLAPIAQQDHLSVVGPSFTRTESFAQWQGQPADYNFGNLHNYFAGRNPGTPGWGDDGYGSYTWNLKHARTAFGSLPLYTTETGYIMDPSISQGIPETVAGRYMVRLLLEQFLHGIRRTYLYELLDTEIPAQHVRDRYGLCRADFSRKPAYLAVQALMQSLGEPASHRNTPSTEQNLSDISWRMSEAPADLHHLLLQKQDGEIDLFLWRELPGYDVDGKRLVQVPAAKLQIMLPTTQLQLSRFRDDGGLEALPSPAPHVATAPFLLGIDDRVVLIRFQSR
jgi:hypothetical protein